MKHVHNSLKHNRAQTDIIIILPHIASKSDKTSYIIVDCNLLIHTINFINKVIGQSQENTDNLMNKLSEVLHQRGIYRKNTDFT